MCLLLQKCKVSIRFCPTLDDEDIRREAVNLIVVKLERKDIEEQQRALEQERDAASQDVQVSLWNWSVSNSFFVHVCVSGVDPSNSHDTTFPLLSCLYSYPCLPSTFNGCPGYNPRKKFGIKDARRWHLKHFWHKYQHLYEPGFLTVSCNYQISERCEWSSDRNTPFFWVIAACQCYKLFDRGRLAIALHYTELQTIFSSPSLKF